MLKLVPGLIDIHSHLLPVQDGPKDMGQAIQALKIAEENNITDIILTPHYFSGNTGYDQQYILKTFMNLKSEIERNCLRIRIFLGNECVVDEKLVEDVQIGKAFTLNKTKYVLCEYPLYQVPCNYHSIIYQCMEAGYKPIIAHPERNTFFERYHKSIMELKQNGCMLQINAGSILGEYGRAIKRNSIRMIKDEYCDYLASDAHSDRLRAADTLNQSIVQIKKWVDKEYIMKLLVKNPGNMIN